MSPALSSAKQPSILGWIVRNTANVENCFHEPFTREMSRYGFLGVKRLNISI